MGPAQWIVLAVTCLRVAELVHARRNERRLRAQGGVEHGAGHYPLFVALHAAWLLAIFFLVPADSAPDERLLTVFAVLQPLRLWVIASLGRFWTTRVITVANAPLVRRGPYRLMRHPNYLVVVLELAILPLAFGAWEIAAIFTILNAALLWHRIRVEETALARPGATG